MQSQSFNIVMTNVSKSYQNRHALRDVTISFASGRIYVLTGPNGSGKSTILKCIMGLLKYDGIIHRAPKRIGYAPEQFILPDQMTVWDFLYHLGRIKSSDRHKVPEDLKKYLKAFGLDSVGDRTIRTLSNGMKQKVNLIQALLHQPELILLDEPFRAIDEDAKRGLMTIIRELSEHTTIIITTHHPEQLRIGRKTMIRIHEGRIVS